MEIFGDTMRFKVGDKVRVVRLIESSSRIKKRYMGGTHTISHVRASDVKYIYSLKEMIYLWAEDELAWAALKEDKDGNLW